MLGNRNSAQCPKCSHEFACCTYHTGGVPLVPQQRITDIMKIPLTTLLAQKDNNNLSNNNNNKLPAFGHHSPPPFALPSPAYPLPPPMFPLPSPPFNMRSPFILVPVHPDADLKRLQATVTALRRSGFYYEGLTHHEADNLLKNCDVGTFLIRNSSDPRYLFALTVQTERGPSSVRLLYTDGSFRLDAQQHLRNKIPSFGGVIDLCQHYSKATQFAWVDAHGHWHSSIILRNPLRKGAAPPTLKHLARLAINRAKLGKQLKELPASLTDYLADYPHSL